MAELPSTTPYPDWLSATLASDATGGNNVLPLWLHPLNRESVVVGPAFVVLAGENDNQAVLQAIAAPLPAGSVLVISGHSTSQTATIGGLMALEIQNLGAMGLITDGLVRDSQEIRQLQMPVWCRGTTAVASAKHNPGVLGRPVMIGSALIRNGDLVIADADGIVVWPQENIPDLLKRAQAKYESDNLRLARLQQQRHGS